MKATSVIPKPVTEYDLRLLRIYRAVVESGGFAAAEGKLGITRSTISNHISSLETRMGLTLCFRGRGGFSLTEEGRQVYHAALKLYESLNDFSLLVSSLGQELSGELVIMYSDQMMGSNQQKLAQVIADIHQQAPQLHLMLEIDSLSNIEKALLQDKAHMGLLPPYHQIHGLEYQALIAEPIYLCCGHSHPLAKLNEDEITDSLLQQQAAIHPGIDIDPIGREQLKKLNLKAKAYQFETRKPLLLSGHYIGYMPQSQIQPELDSGEIKLIKPDKYSYEFNLSMAHKSRPKEEDKVALIRGALLAQF